jgi:hypothetical protein
MILGMPEGGWMRGRFRGRAAVSVRRFAAGRYGRGRRAGGRANGHDESGLFPTGPRVMPGPIGGLRMRAFRKWASKGDPTRDALVRHFADAIACLEDGRAAAPDDVTRGQLQKLVGDLQGLRAKLESLPDARLAKLATVRELQSLDNAVESALNGKNDAAKADGLRAGREAVAAIARQFA